MNMSKEEKKVNLAVSRRRYIKLGTKKAKGLFLDQFCALSGLERKHVIKRLRGHAGSARRGHPRSYDMDARQLLTDIWKLSDRLCGKLLHAVIGMWVESLKRRTQVDAEAERQVLIMSASTMDRLLRNAKHRCGPSRRRQDSLGEHRREIPLKIEAWPDQSPAVAGWIEVDTVAHCGGSMSGNFVWTLTFTDVASQWTEMRCVWNKGAAAIVVRIEGIVLEVPFSVAAFNSDNGGEFLNGHLKRYFPALCPQAMRTRSRAYCKNDNAHVEQKNGHRVRRLFGYGRIDRPELVEAMNEVAKLRSLFDNLYTPTQRLISKRKEGHKYIKRFENPPKTPAQRILEDPSVSQEHKRRVSSLLAANDPLELRGAVESKIKQLAKLTYLIETQINKSDDVGELPPGGPAGPPGNPGLRPPKGPPLGTALRCRHL